MIFPVIEEEKAFCYPTHGTTKAAVPTFQTVSRRSRGGGGPGALSARGEFRMGPNGS